MNRRDIIKSLAAISLFSTGKARAKNEKQIRYCDPNWAEVITDQGEIKFTDSLRGVLAKRLGQSVHVFITEVKDAWLVEVITKDQFSHHVAMMTILFTDYREKTRQEIIDRLHAKWVIMVEWTQDRANTTLKCLKVLPS